MRTHQKQRGVTMLIVLILLTVMLLGGLAMARMTEVGTVAVGNAGFRNAALQASEVGLNTAFQGIADIAVTAEDADAGNWYWSTNLAQDANGLPVVDWALAPEIAVGDYRVRYVAERVCTVAAVVDPLLDCLVRQALVPASADPTREKVDPPNSKQYRVTVRVTGPKETTTFVQSLFTKG